MFFDNYGRQIRGTGSDIEVFVNALQGQDRQGRRVAGWRHYNSDAPKAECDMLLHGIQQMQRDLSAYLVQRGC